LGILLVLNPLRKHEIDADVVVHGQPELLQVVGALNAAGGFPRRLNGRQQQGDQNGDDRNDDKQLDEREASPQA